MLDLENTYINKKQDFARFQFYGDAGQAVIFELHGHTSLIRENFFKFLYCFENYIIFAFLMTHLMDGPSFKGM